VAITNKDVENIMCVACNELIKDHSKRGLGRCLFRIQGTMVSNGLSPYKAHTEDRIEDQK